MEIDFSFTTIVMFAFSLLMFGAIVQTQVPKEWQTTGGLLFISFVGIPAGFALAGLMINIPWLFVGVAVFAGIHSSKTN